MATKQILSKRKYGFIIKIWTIGHSTHSFEDRISLLKHYGLEILVDIRRFLNSKKVPHFNQEYLQSQFTHFYINYLWLGDDLGG
ncbi:MAG: DUF488 family protein, partial [Candidatus Thorarchaeota archaeon]